MIDLKSETVIRLADCPAYLPKAPSGRRLHKNALYRWVRAGVRGVRLEAISVGGILCTSVEALQRFCDALTAQEFPNLVSPPQTSRQRQRASAAAEKELEAAGL
jgi:hypothetical protein